MTVEVEIFGNEQHPKHKSNIVTYSYAEEATPIIPGDSSGGVGSISFEAIDYQGFSPLLYHDEVYLTDSHNGSISGKILSVGGNGSTASFSGVSNLSRLNIINTVPAVDTTVGELILYVFDLAGINSGIDIHEDIENIPLTTPAYDGDLWVFIKDLCTAQEIEIALVDDVIKVRPLRQNSLKIFDTADESWAISEVSPAQFVEVNYYNYQPPGDFLAYPKGGWNDDVQVYQVDANQVMTIEIPVEAYLNYVVQPQIRSTVGKYDSTESVYCVAGKDGLPVTPLQWINNGGNLHVEVAEQGELLIVTITGANIPDLAPFRIGVSSGPSDYYSSLRIMGNGIAYEQKTLTYPTGLTEEETSNEVGMTIDNKFIDTYEQASDAARRAIVKYAIPNQTYSFSAPNIGDFINVPAIIIYADQFFEYDAQIGDTINFGELDLDIGLESFTEFDNSLPNTVVSDGSSQQLFGNVAGSRVRYRDSWYRVKSANITQDIVSATAEWDNLISDLNSNNVGKTFETFNQTFDQLTFTDFSIVPMRGQ